LEKEEIKKKYFINDHQEALLSSYLDILYKNNLHTNLVGKSTLTNPWTSHILDSIQILPFINNKKLKILDMGSGAGLPGIPLCIAGCQNVCLVDSNNKKIKFLRAIKEKLNIDIKIILDRLENINNLKFDIITSRALANLNKLFSYSQKFLKKNTLIIFLKGKAANEELLNAKKNWNFEYFEHQSLSDQRGKILIIKNLKKND